MKRTYLLSLESEEMANVMDMLRFLTNVSDRRDGFECKIVTSPSRCYFPAEMARNPRDQQGLKI